MWFQMSLLLVLLAIWFTRLRTDRAVASPGVAVRKPRCAPAFSFLASLFFLLYAAFHQMMPLIFGHVLLAVGFSWLLLGLLPDSGRKGSFGLIALALLALPIMPTVQYVVGFPLRLLVAEVSSLWLGSSVRAVGTGLVSGDHTVFVDAPCSGVSMLFTALVLAAFTALVLRLSPPRTAFLIGIGFVGAVLGNVTRAVGLFVIETRIGSSDILHEGVGIINFALCALLVVWAGLRLRKGEGRGRGDRHAPPVRGRSRASAGFFFLSCLAAALVPFGGRIGEAAAFDGDSAIVWPRTWNGRALIEVPLDAQVKEFLGIFPGRMAEFAVCGSDERILLRWTPVATRKLHPAEGCFRAMGGTVTPLAAVRDRSAKGWSRFRVDQPDGSGLLVRQCYLALGEGGHGLDLADMIAGADSSWPDASAWYWSAALGGSEVRSTLAVTISSPEPP